MQGDTARGGHSHRPRRVSRIAPPSDQRQALASVRQHRMRRDRPSEAFHCKVCAINPRRLSVVNGAPEVYIDTGGLEIPAEVSCTGRMSQDTVRIGCGCGFWGDSAAGPAQLVRGGAIDVLVLDYLSEITLSLLARARRKRPELGYTPDFVHEVMRPLA